MSLIKSSVMKIRLAQATDAKAIAEVHVASWQSAYQGILPDKMLANLSIETRANNWQAWLEQSQGQTLVLEVDEQIRGFVMYGPTRDKDVDRRVVGEIYAIYLHPHIWRQGYGRELVNEVKTLLQHQGCTELLLWVLDDNKAAICFYEKVGFRSDGVSKIEFEPDGTELFESRYRQPIIAAAPV